VAALKPVRGTHDILTEDARRFRRIVEVGRATALRYLYDEVATPIFELTEVFQRTLGDTSDIVTKEMYSFEDKGGDKITLRPEGTAGIARAVISGGLAQEAPLKFFYSGPMFRYERPQKGRLRQFHQIGVELIGVAEPAGDVEVIALGAAILAALGLADKITLELNTLGNSASRAAYRSRLIEYLDARRDRLSDDSLRRLDRNPLRILDSKDPGDRDVIADAPLLENSLDADSSEFFAAVKAGLDALGIRYVVSPRLVRGLDYYCHTAFEFTTEALGAQGTVLAGGRYDGLIGTMGGPELAGVGWAAGIERLAMMVEAPAPSRPVAVIPIGEAAEVKALTLANSLRDAGFAVELGYRGNLRRRLARANKLNARVAVMLGEDELAKGAATVRDLDSGTQNEVALDRLAERLAPYR
jgi:histidyl-tRNA synthetase